MHGCGIGYKYHARYAVCGAPSSRTARPEEDTNSKPAESRRQQGMNLPIPTMNQYFVQDGKDIIPSH